MGKPAQIKTKPTASSVEDFINNIEDEQKTQRQLFNTCNDGKSVERKTENVGNFIDRLW